MKEEKLQNLVLDLKRVESANTLEDLLDYDFELKDYNVKVANEEDFINKFETLTIKTEEWLEFQSALILRLEKDIINYVKEIL